MSAPLFPLGRVVATPQVLEVADWCDLFKLLLGRHVRGDWGCVRPEDAASNDRAVRDGHRILSVYAVDSDVEPCCGCCCRSCVWIITEADRSVTTILLPEEY